MRKISFIVILVVLSLMTASFVFAEGAKEGDVTPKIILKDVRTNQPTKLNEIIKGKVTVLVYMQTSCAACRKELEALKNMKDFVPELNIIAVSVDAGCTNRIKKYIDHYKFDFMFLHDPSFTTPELFNFSFTPATVVIVKDGKIIALKGGYRKGDEKKIMEIVQDALKK